MRRHLALPKRSGKERCYEIALKMLRQVDAGNLDDGLPRGFLAGAIVEVRVSLRLNWA
jgi:hypothetical protein